MCLFSEMVRLRSDKRKSSWSRRYATSRKVSESHPDEVTWFLIDLIVRAALGFTLPLSEYISGGKARPERKAEKLTALSEPIV
jgi:hypothetical protein